jgi:predicted AlkP superfamily pyrophosphatase or phosphodiesterase
MIYIEQLDGSGHQFTLTDPRQASDFTNPNSIGANQDAAKVARYDAYLKFAYQQANKALAEIMKTVGDRANVFVVSDHGMAPFHTAVSMTNLLKAARIDTTKLGIRTNGPRSTSTSTSRAASPAAP